MEEVRHHPNVEATIAEIRTQIKSIVDDHHDLSEVVGRLAGEMRAGFAAIHAKLDSQSAPKWGVIFTGLGVLVAVLGMAGTLAYLPIKADIDNLKQSQIRSYDQLVDRDQRMWTEIMRNMRELSYLTGQLHPLGKP